VADAETRQAQRRALAHRLAWLAPVLGSPALRTTLRAAGWVVLVGWLLFVALVLVLRYAVLPGIAKHHGEIEQALTRAVGQPVSIGRIEARWEGLNPDLVLTEVVVADRQGAPVFTLSQVEAVLSWQTLLQGQPMLSLLVLERPVLHVRRENDGRLTVAGIDAEGESDPALADWVSRQKRIRVRDATVVWEDRLRQAPPLVLEDLQFGLDNRGSRHRFGLSAAPPAELAARIDVRGEIDGDFGTALEQLSGRIYVELDYADLAGWRSWVDYPFDLPEGRGALRVWGDFAEGTGKATADLALEEVRLRLRPKLPALELTSLRGRLEGGYKAGEWTVAGRKLELLTADATRVAPTDFRAIWRTDPASGKVSGSAEATYLDLDVLGRLAAHLPLDAATLRLLESHRPQGRITEPRLGWSIAGETLERYSLKAAFVDLGLRAGGYFPGARGLDGMVELNEQGGSLSLDAPQSALSLPAVFPEPDLAFDQLRGRATWKVAGGAVDLRLERLQFEGANAAGSASGTYRFSGEGPGEIDLAASVSRAEGKSIWRFMPHAVSQDTREWLQRALLAGRGHDGKLVLKGNLADFPFRDPAKGVFQVTARAADVKLDYAEGWPVIEGIVAELSFGVGMRVVASKGTILGAQLADVVAEIPDFESFDEQLIVSGKASGPTAEFLQFIERSPVSAMIDHFTRDMKATGNGRLDLALDMPLRKIGESRVRGEYQFANNQLQPVPGLPMLTQVNGRLSITEKSLSAREITGQGFGGPLKVQVRSDAGRVGILAAGTADIGEVGRHFAWPLLDRLSGRTDWKAEIGISQGSAAVVVESDLLGVAAQLPEPLAKKAVTALPLRIERSAPDAAGERYRIRLGTLFEAVMIRRQEAWERGVVAIGEAEPRLPERGLDVRIALPQLDVDAWRAFLPDNVAGESGGVGLAPVTLAVKAGELRLMGRDFHKVDAALRPRNQGWQIAIDSREAAGDLFWQSAGAGWVEGNLKHLVLRRAAETTGSDTAVLNSLPGMNIKADSLAVGDLQLGALELKGRNEKGVWQLDTLNIRSPNAVLKARGQWQNVGQHKTRLDFELTASDVGRLLDQLGHVDAVKRGSAKLAGDLNWNGEPTGIDYPSLTGRMTVEAAKGQFNKLDPGVGKLLGLISLQSLPRRLTLDFRDIFSEGLAFDSIESSLAVSKGIMRTVEPLSIRGPSAEIEMTGETDLKAETQDLRVEVRPELGAIATVGATLINPIAGAATLIVSATGKNPLNRLFSYRYHVTGTWSDPVVAKESVAQVPVAGETKK
jgi:uncharacterized protein (TIGR02099 family)